MKRLDLTGEGAWFHRGKEARLRGEPRDLLDGRMSPRHREAFARGWEEQDWRMRARTPEEIAEANAKIARLKAEIAQALSTQP